MGLENVDRLDGVLGLIPVVGRLDGLHGINSDLGEEVGVGADDFTRHGRLSDVDEGFASEVLDLDANIIAEVLDSFAQGKTVAGNDGGGVYTVLHQLVSATEQLCGDEDDGGSAVANLLVLLLCEVDEDLAGRVIDIEELEDRGSVVGDGDVLGYVSAWFKYAVGGLPTPISSTIILSRPLGPKELLTTFAMACVASTILYQHKLTYFPPIQLTILVTNIRPRNLRATQEEGAVPRLLKHGRHVCRLSIVESANVGLAKR